MIDGGSGGIVRKGDWVFEVVEVRARKVAEYGEPYSATGTITIVDGEPHIEGLLSTEKLTASDKTSLNQYVGYLGYDYYITSIFIDKERVMRKVGVGDGK
tara:strand:- start:374 stop:673 length:300 start_codon:yes stop_codon:yes gene_type:complete